MTFAQTSNDTSDEAVLAGLLVQAGGKSTPHLSSLAAAH